MITIAISTWNNLKYLKASIESLQKNSCYDNEICICADGCTDETLDWLVTQDGIYDWTFNEKHTGSITGRNKAVELGTKDYLFLSEDAFIYRPHWDKGVIEWAKMLGKYYIFVPTLVENEFGKNIEDFDEISFLKHAEKISEDWFDAQHSFGLPIMRTDLYWEVDGEDVNYDPISFSLLDLKVRLKRKFDDIIFAKLNDWIVYHFPRKSWEHLRNTKEFNQMIEDRKTYFGAKLGMRWDDARRWLDEA